MTQLTLLLALFLSSFSANAYYDETDLDQYKGKTEMSGIRHQDYRGFEKKWKLVTVRYRKDSSEMRFTYANPKAWAAMQSGGKNYPEGSVFAKISVITAEDPRFVSSAVPNGSQRIQYMVRSEKKYGETQGWGYALFDAEGKTYPEEPKLKARACAACHLIAQGTGYVFSEELKFFSPPAGPAKLMSLTFVQTEKSKLPASLQEQLPRSAEKIFLLDSPISNALFQGTLEEIKPVLAKQVRSSGQPAALLSKERDRFSAAFPISQEGCANNKAIQFVITKPPVANSKPVAQKNSVCESDL